MKINDRFHSDKIISVLVTTILIINIIKIVPGLGRNLLPVISNPFASSKEKMEMSFGKQFYDYVDFVKANTPENSRILIPPQGFPWPQTGNAAYMRYFLYPRTLMSGKEFEPGVDLIKEKYDYVLIAWGESKDLQFGFTNGWPKFNVKAESVTYLSTNGKGYQVTGDYIFDKESKGDLWGIAKVKK